MASSKPMDELIYVDEAGFILWMARTLGCAPQGQHAVCIVGDRREPNFTVILAVSNARGLIRHQINQGGTEIQNFNAIFADASQAAGDDERAAFIMDNAPCH